MNNLNETNFKNESSNSKKGEGRRISDSNISEFSLDNEIRIIICWNCQTQVAIGHNWKKVICPVCGMLNIIPKIKEESMRPNIDLNFDCTNVVPFMVVVCPFCEYSMKTKRESDYLTCTSCKNTIIIIKSEENSLELMEFKIKNLNQYKQTEYFNPYLREKDDRYRLECGFEKEMVKDYNQARKQNKGKEKTINEPNKFTNKYQICKPLIETMNEIEENIKNINYKKFRKGSSKNSEDIK
jgi:hypothetical protein